MVVAATWALKWFREGPAPSGPSYNSAKEFISRLDVFAHHTVHEWPMRIATTASTWFSADLGACYTVSFAVLILLAGTLQWLLLGQLVQWADKRFGRKLSLALFGLFALWGLGSLILWIAV